MTNDVDELVLDAFRVEYKEQLEQLRTLIGTWQVGERLANHEGVREAFRLVHSFKGGARVCGLNEAERMGHLLEEILERLSRDDLPLTTLIIAKVSTLLDSIEDWMSALDGQQPFPDISKSLTSMEAVTATEELLPPAKNATTGNQLLPVFFKELEQHSAQIRQFLARWQACEGPLPSEELSDAARVAHTLAGAAAVVDMRPIETSASKLDQIFLAIRANQRCLDAPTLCEIERCLDGIAQAAHDLQRHTQKFPPQTFENCEKSQAAEQKPAALPDSVLVTKCGTRDADGTPLIAANESVRVTIDCLDRLMRSSDELLAGNQDETRITRALAALQRDIVELQHEHDTVRRTAASALHELAEHPRFNRIARYIERIDRQTGDMARRTRQLLTEQRRVAWQWRTRSAQVERHVQQARLVPAHSIFQGFRKMVRDLAKSEGKLIDFHATGMDVRADRMVLQALKDPIMHVLRNCVSHGIELPRCRRQAGKSETGQVSIGLDIWGGRLNVTIDDDGQGIDIRKIQEQALRQGLLSETGISNQSTDDALSLVFAPGLSTATAVTELAGRGIGLSIVRDTVSRLQGHVRVANRAEGGVQVAISVPMVVSTHRVLLVTAGGRIMAIPIRAIEQLLRVPLEKLESMEGRPIVTCDRRPIQLFRLSDLLGISELLSASQQTDATPIVLLRSGSRSVAIAVDALVEERDAIILELDEFAQSATFAGGISLDDGNAVLVLQPSALMEAAHRIQSAQMRVSPPHVEPAAAAKLLIVDDSFTTRTLEKNILEAEGYEVHVAIDGVEALSLMRQHKFALVVTDIEMPRMDGFALLERMKADSRLAKTPVILVTSRDRQEDQQHGLDLGADAYIVKRKFDHQELLNTIRQLL